MALTATATIDVKEDICALLYIDHKNVIETSTKRDNLKFIVDPTYQKQKMVIDYINNHKDESGIIYASTRKQVETLSEVFSTKGIQHAIYHAGLKKKRKNRIKAHLYAMIYK